MKRKVLGTMTGTSCDGLDLALLEVEGKGLYLKTTFLEGRSHDLGGLGPKLRALAEGLTCTMEELCQLNHDFSSFHVQCIKDADFGPLDLIALHGQTLYHAPPLGLQLIDLSLIAAQLKTPIVGDLRGVDMAKGGQGAPITPLADEFFYGKKGERRVIINLGGFCNLTLLPGQGEWEDIRGYDVCTANLLLDLLARKILARPYDENGQGAMQGQNIPPLRKSLEGRLRQQKIEGKSLGQNDLPNMEWFKGYTIHKDLLTTACGAIGTVIGESVVELNADRLFVAGGGANNPVLLKSIESVSELSPEPCDDHGPPSEYREAAAIALLGALSQDRIPITLPNVTGAKGSFISGLHLDPRLP